MTIQYLGPLEEEKEQPQGPQYLGPLTQEDVGESYSIVSHAQEELKKQIIPDWMSQGMKETGKEILGDIKGEYAPLAKGEFDVPTAIYETVAGLSAGMLGFADEMLTRIKTQMDQLVFEGKIDPAEAFKAGEMRSQLYDFQPKDPLAKAALNFISAIPLGIEKAAEVLSDQFENPNIKAAIKTAGWFGSLGAFGKVFKTLKTPFNAKEGVKILSDEALQKAKIKEAADLVTETPEKPLDVLKAKETKLRKKGEAVEQAKAQAEAQAKESARLAKEKKISDFMEEAKKVEPIAEEPAYELPEVEMRDVFKPETKLKKEPPYRAIKPQEPKQGIYYKTKEGLKKQTPEEVLREKLEQPKKEAKVEPEELKTVPAKGMQTRKRFDVENNAYEITKDGERKVVRWTDKGFEEIEGVKPKYRIEKAKVVEIKPKEPQIKSTVEEKVEMKGEITPEPEIYRISKPENVGQTTIDLTDIPEGGGVQFGDTTWIKEKGGWKPEGSKDKPIGSQFFAQRIAEEIKAKPIPKAKKALKKKPIALGIKSRGSEQNYLVPWIAKSGGIKEIELAGELRDMIWTVDAKGRKKLVRGLMPGFTSKTGRGLDEVVRDAREAGFAVEDTDQLLELIEKDLAATRPADRITRLTDTSLEDKMWDDAIKEAEENDISERDLDSALREEIASRLADEAAKEVEFARAEREAIQAESSALAEEDLSFKPEEPAEKPIPIPDIKHSKLMPYTKRGDTANQILMDKDGIVYEGRGEEHIEILKHFNLKPDDIQKAGMINMHNNYVWKGVEGRIEEYRKLWKDALARRERGEPEVLKEQKSIIKEEAPFELIREEAPPKTLGPQHKKAVFPTEKIPTKTTGKQAGITKEFEETKKGESYTLLESGGLQSLYEKGSEWAKHAKEGRTEKVRQAAEAYRNEFLQPVKGNPLDKCAIAFLKTEKFADYLREMPSIGELRPSEIFKYDPTAKKLISTIETKDGKLKPAIRQSGFHALKEFSDDITGYKDISKLSASWTDPTRMIQEMDQGRWGGPVQKHVLWPNRMTVLAKLKWADLRKASLHKLIEKYNVTSGKKAEAIGDILEHISSEEIKATPDAILRKPKVREFLKKFKPKTQTELVTAAQKLRDFADKLIKAQNVQRRLRKQKDIPYRTFYRPWIMETNLWSKLLGQKMRPKEIMDSPEMPDFIFPNKPFNPRAEARTGLLKKYPKERNIITLFSDYIETAAKDIFDTNVVHHNKIHSAVMKSKGLEVGADALDRYTAEVYAGVDPRLTKWAKEHVPPPARQFVLQIRRNLTRAVFPLNWTWNLFVQTSSAGLTHMRYGTKSNTVGLKYMTSPKIRAGIKQNAYSSIVKSRWGGKAHYQDIQNSILKNKRLEAKPIEKAEDFANFLTNAIEDSLTGHAVVAAMHHGKTKLGLKGRQLWEYASEGGAKTQSMYNYGDLPGMLRAREVGALAPFQTFAFEVFNTVREMNVPGLRRVIGKTGLYETLSANSVEGKALMSNRLKMIARWTAAIMVANAVGETTIGRKPWQITSFVPFLGYVMGRYAGKGPVPHQYVEDAKRGFRHVLQYGDFKQLRKWLLRYHALAGVQIERTLESIETVAKGGRVTDVRGRTLFTVKPEDYLRALTMGPYRTEAGKEYFEKKSKKSTTKKIL